MTRRVTTPFPAKNPPPGKASLRPRDTEGSEQFLCLRDFELRGWSSSKIFRLEACKLIESLFPVWRPRRSSSPGEKVRALSVLENMCLERPPKITRETTMQGTTRRLRTPPRDHQHTSNACRKYWRDSETLESPTNSLSRKYWCLLPKY